ncbi:MAG: hypothetical protein C4B55_04895 [Candidatus Methanophagaceae archaeon]|nr:MAG: hypothetical protein C4B55_04895 [Methanophagales archaeon]
MVTRIMLKKKKIEKAKFITRGALYFLHLNLSRYANRSPPAPLLVNLQITRRCNLKCIHCDIREVPEKYSDIINKEFSTEELKKIINSIKSMGTSYISISGGEPFLRKDIFEVIEYVKRRDLGLHISSNGSLIGEQAAKRINDSGLDAISISLDAVTPGLHDKIRGIGGTFERTVAAIKYLVDYKDHTQVGISPIITGLNLEELPRLVDFANDLGVDAIRFQPWHVSLGHKETEEMLIIRGKRLDVLDEVIEQIIERTKKYGIYTNCDVYLRGMRRFFEDINRIEIDCFAGSFSCNISWTGDVVPCAFIPAIGNVRNEPFEKIWNSRRFNDVRKEIKKGNCQKCWMGCFIEPSLRCSLKYVVQNPLKYISDLRFYYRFM